MPTWRSSGQVADEEQVDAQDAVADQEPVGETGAGRRWLGASMPRLALRRPMTLLPRRGGQRRRDCCPSKRTSERRPATTCSDGAVVRLRLDVAYDGTEFSGWAQPTRARTVQSTVEDALVMVCGLPDVRLTVAGRTDAGVHARGQVCHLDVDTRSRRVQPGPRPATARLDRLLPDDVRVRSVGAGAGGFRRALLRDLAPVRLPHLRQPGERDPLARGHVLAWPAARRERDERGGRSLVGEHDFAAFCQRREGATTVRDLRGSSGAAR